MDVCFREVNGRALFIVSHGIRRDAAQATILVPPFGEEMNRCRRFFLSLSTALARNGHFVMLPDLSGTGDSAGALEEVAWTDWVCELRSLIDTVAADTDAPVNLVALRTGALLAAEASFQQNHPPASLRLICPVVDGRKFLDELLRLKLAAALSSGERANRADFWAQWQEGQSVRVAGYPIPAQIALPLSSRCLSDFPPDPTAAVSVYWTGEAGAGSCKGAPAGLCSDVAVETVVAPAFWRQAEPEPAPALIAALGSVLTLEVPS